MIKFRAGGEWSESGWRVAPCVLRSTTDDHNFVGNTVDKSRLLLELPLESNPSAILFYVNSYINHERPPFRGCGEVVM